MDDIIWCGDKPDVCQLCPTKIEDVFVDGKTKAGPWAIMCPFCALAHGVGLGIGKGQLYGKTVDDNFVKMRG